MSMQVESSDVIKIIQQFLKENHLSKSLAALQEETGIRLNAATDLDTIAQNILSGKWDIVLRHVAQQPGSIPTAKLTNLYEHIIIELIEDGELGTARRVLRETDVMHIVRDRQSDRYVRLEQMLTRASIETPKTVLSDRETRRSELAREICTEFTTVSGGRLLTLLNHAVKWQFNNEPLPKEMKYDLFRGTVASTVSDSDGDYCPTSAYANIKFGRKNHAEAAVFSPDGEFFATGTIDGFIEIWNHMTGKLRKDLQYQAEENIMCVSSPVLSLAFSQDSEHLASGTQDGQISIWNVKSGALLRVFERAHTAAIVSLQFSSDGTQVLSAGFDNTVRVFGLNSGKMIREFRGHTSFVNRAIFVSNGTEVMSVSSDGSLRIWDAKTSMCTHTASPNPFESHIIPTLLTVVAVPRRPNTYLLCLQSMLLTVNNRGKIMRKLFLPEKMPDKSQFVAAATSAQGDIIYGATSDGHLHAYNSDTGALIATMKLHSTEIIGLAVNPVANVMASFADDGELIFWRP